ncbi:MAG: putative metalloprotease CJM1_0395 family protein [Thiogranum sp.]|nr:putative metalloprotease CJM1_0395 family protein [Thiogranum sp.]
MNIDTQAQPFAAIASPTRAVHKPAEQISNRPVERPHHTEAAQHQGHKEIAPSDKRPDQSPPDGNNRSSGQDADFSSEEKQALERLAARDREVRAHEAAHKNAAGNLARGSAQFEYENGSDGRRYAVAGEVSIDVSKVQGDAEATIRKAEAVRRAAHAPAQPSAQDHAVAAQANRMAIEARRELDAREHGSPAPADSGYQSDAAAAAPPVGTLLDVNV